MIRRGTYQKRREDLLGDVDAGTGTTAEEDARLRQQSPSNFYGENGGGLFHQSEAPRAPGPSPEEQRAQEEQEFEQRTPLDAWEYHKDPEKLYRFLQYHRRKLNGNQSPNAENRSQQSTGSAGDDELLNNPAKYNRRNQI